MRTALCSVHRPRLLLLLSGARLVGLLGLGLQHLGPLLAERRLGEPGVVHLLLLPAAVRGGSLSPRGG